MEKTILGDITEPMSAPHPQDKGIQIADMISSNNESLPRREIFPSNHTQRKKQGTESLKEEIGDIINHGYFSLSSASPYLMSALARAAVFASE